MKNYLRKEYSADDDILIPAGVKKIKLTLLGQIQGGLISAASGRPTGHSIDPFSLGWGWGNNVRWQVGNNSQLATSSPVLLSGNKTWILISDGHEDSGALDNAGLAWAWGENSAGSLGIPDGIARSSPVQVIGNVKWRMLSGGGSGFSGVTTKGEAWGWGKGNSGELGNNSTNLENSSPVQVSGNKKWLMVARGYSTWCGLDTDNLLWACGENDKGAIGDGTTVDKSSPVQVIGNKTWIWVCSSRDISSAQRFHAIDENNDGWSWGASSRGGLGDGNGADFWAVSSPVQILGNHKFVKIMASNTSSAGLDRDGIIWTWGDNSFGQLGDGTVVGKSSPVQVIGNKTWLDVAVGTSFMVATDTEGLTWTWGFNNHGQLGDNSVVAKSSPVQVVGNKRWVFPNIRTINEMNLDVVPNKTYSLSIYSDIITFGAIPLGYSMGMMPKVIMEYYQ